MSDYNYVAADLQKSLAEMTAERDRWQTLAMAFATKFLTCERDTCACKECFEESSPDSRSSF